LDLAPLYAGNGWTAQRAGRDDDAALCALVRDVRLRGALDMAQERDPSFFALLDCHGSHHQTTVIKDAQGGVQGCGSVVVRDGHLFGAVRKVAYLCDLRIRPEFSGRGVLSISYGKQLDLAVRDHGVDAAYIVVIGSNARMRSIVDAKHPGMPVHLPLCSFDMTSAQLTSARRRRPSTRVSTATAADLDELAAFLDAEQARRTFGYVRMGDVIAKRLRTWPGFSLDAFFVARDAHGIRGCLALWDSSPVKRTRIMGYGGSFRWVKRASDLLAPLGGFRRLPAPGDLLRYQYATHLEVKDDDPDVLGDLVHAAKARLDRREWHFLSAMIPVGSPLARAFSGPFVQRTRMQLHALVPQTSPWRDHAFATLRPGFEMALN
jgi:hypothetical protein